MTLGAIEKEVRAAIAHLPESHQTTVLDHWTRDSKIDAVLEHRAKMTDDVSLLAPSWRIPERWEPMIERLPTLTAETFEKMWPQVRDGIEPVGDRRDG